MPVIIQDAHSGLVLTLAYANEEALKRTEETGQTHLWSRSRQELWHKGATSGNTQEVVEIRVDCDEDALLYRIIPAGPACHTGEETCFYRTMANGDASPDDRPVLERLEGIIADRKISPQEGSYTTSLFSAGENEIVKKLGEEAVEVVVAAKGESQDRIIYEVADLVYHTFVLLAERGLAWSDVEAELARRYRE